MIALPLLAILCSGWTVLLLAHRAWEQALWALHPDAHHASRHSDRTLVLTCALSLCLIALSLWSLK